MNLNFTLSKKQSGLKYSLLVIDFQCLVTGHADAATNYSSNRELLVKKFELETTGDMKPEKAVAKLEQQISSFYYTWSIWHKSCF